MKWLSNDLRSMLTVATIAAMITMSLPVEALRFQALTQTEKGSRLFTAAFVRLSPEAERIALRNAKTSWGGSDSVRHLRADMSPAELPEDTWGCPVLKEMDVVRRSVPPLVEAGLSPFLPSLKAEPPSPIASIEASEDELLTFTKSELLKLENELSLTTTERQK